ncbi:MAG: glycosyltransferase involved in cell wall biosynthesis [Bacteroidia bacterium]
MNKTRKVICTVTNDLYTDQRMIRICTSLANAGFEVVLVGRQLSSSNELISRPFKQIRLSNWFNTGVLFYLEFNLRLWWYLGKQDFDFLTNCDADTLLSGFLTQTNSNKRKTYQWMFDAHELFYEVPELVGKPIKQKIWKWLMAICVPKVDIAYTVTKTISAHYEKVFKKSFSVIRNVPVLRSKEVVEPRSENKTHQVILLYQGALNKGRCIELYIRAMHQLNAELWLVGEGDLSASLKLMVEREGLSDKVTFHGLKSPEELRLLTNKAVMGLNLLENLGLSYYYSLSNKTFDYMHAHLPALASPFPEYVELNKKFEIMLLTEPSVQNLVTNVNLLVENKDVYQRLSDNCKLAQKECNWTNEEIKLLSLYGVE